MPSIQEQVDEYLSTKPADIGTALIVVAGGLNDVFFNASVTATQSVSGMVGAMNRLRAHGI